MISLSNILTCVLILAITYSCLREQQNIYILKSKDGTSSVGSPSVGSPSVGTLSIENNNIQEINLLQQRKEYDRKIDQDTLIPPTRRLPLAPKEYIDQHKVLNGAINIPTQGYPDSFQYLGNLYRQEDNMYVKLYGRKRHNEIWDYYGIFNDPNGMMIKIAIETKNNLQLMPDDTTTITTFEGGEFKAMLHKRNDYPYYPQLFD